MNDYLLQIQFIRNLVVFWKIPVLRKTIVWNYAIILYRWLVLIPFFPFVLIAAMLRAVMEWFISSMEDLVEFLTRKPNQAFQEHWQETRRQWPPELVLQMTGLPPKHPRILPKDDDHE